MFREWLKELIREALKEERIKTSYIIKSDYEPTGSDYQHPPGALWETDDGTIFTLDHIKAVWVPFSGEV